ncbi:hypothetical protein D1872_337060 [compost metagenome]
MPMMTVVIRTPIVASERALEMTGRIVVYLVCMPPSNRMTIKAKVPTNWARKALSK